MIGIPLLVAIVAIGFWTVAFATFAASALSAVELVGLMKGKRSVRLGDIGAGVMFVGIPSVGIVVGILTETSVYASHEQATVWMVAIGTVASVSMLTLIWSGLRSGKDTASGVVVVAFGILSATALATLPLTATAGDGLKWIAMALFTVFAADTAAFFVGRSIGSRRLAPTISPRKTVEGLVGGVVAAVIASWIIATVVGLEIQLVWVIGFGIVAGLLGALGDLIESWVKRLVEAKNSGSSIPGHGGLLDRTDSLILNFLFVYFVAWWAV